MTTETEPAETEPVNDATTQPDPTPGSDDTEPTPGSDDTEDQQATGNREARYRTRLRETEADRDRLAAHLATMQRAEVERLAAEHLVKPSGLWASGVTVEALLDENGRVDPAKVQQATAAAIDSLGLHPYVAPPSPLPGGGARPAPRSGRSFTSAFGPRR